MNRTTMDRHDVRAVITAALTAYADDASGWTGCFAGTGLDESALDMIERRALAIRDAIDAMRDDRQVFDSTSLVTFCEDILNAIEMAP